MPGRNIAILMIAAFVSFACHQKAHQFRYAGTITKAVNTIEERYVDEVDPRQLFENAMQGMVTGLDPHSSYVAPKGFKHLQETLDQKFGGIGIVVEGPPRVERLTVSTPIVGTPAYRAGMIAGDVILEIDGTSTEGMTLEAAVDLMRGPIGQPVRLEIKHPGADEPVKLTIRRESIPIESVLGDRRRPDGSWEYFLEEEPRIGYIRLTSFGEETVNELHSALQFEDHPVAALILDLRGNAGGLLHSAVDTCDLFIDRGEIVSTRGRNGVVQQRYSATQDISFDPKKPMVVLVDQFSASASEIVAACLQDHGRAVIVGRRSFGKGTVQNIIELERGRSALKLTTARYWRPSGRNIHRVETAGEDDDWGVRPNDGFEVILEDDEYTQVGIQRRQRDLMVVPRENPSGDATPLPPPPAPVPDPEPEIENGPTTPDAPPDESPASPPEPPREDPSDRIDSDLPTPPPASDADDSVDNRPERVDSTDELQSPSEVEKPGASSGEGNEPDASDARPAGESSDDTEDNEPVDDRQLRRAIEFLRGKLDGLSEAKRTA